MPASVDGHLLEFRGFNGPTLRVDAGGVQISEIVPAAGVAQRNAALHEAHAGMAPAGAVRPRELTLCIVGG